MRAVLIAAEGKHFCTGADLVEVQGLREDRAKLAEFIATGHATLCRLEASALPVVAAVQGLCLAGGLELMLACDVAFAAAAARFGDQHAQFGLIPGWGGSQRLTRTSGCGGRWTCSSAPPGSMRRRRRIWVWSTGLIADAALRAEAMPYCRSLGDRSRAGWR